MSDGWILIGIGVLVLASIVYELTREPGKGTLFDGEQAVARDMGRLQAAQGFGREDYPLDYTDAEREAWQRGWDEYMEGRS